MEPPVSQPLQAIQGAGTSAKSPDCRRRRSQSHQAILTAATELLEEKGYAGVCIEAIAQRAGVGKQTIYRWWPCKAAVIMEAYATQSDQAIALPHTGSIKADLLEILGQITRVLTQTPAGLVIIGLLAEAQTDLKVAEAFQQQFVTQHRTITRTILANGIERGELRPALNVEVAIDMLFGAVWYRLLLNISHSIKSLSKS
ncbi:MAG: TetR/AcrR family transcriptional regulator [Leptolyngbyaceae cyanobacterium CRU_2_3]|nr:TetR/AcrR family transcriptional regulator [Leptolyngbyaceae cyanobacterium CRU_2_3]